MGLNQVCFGVCFGVLNYVDCLGVAEVVVRYLGGVIMDYSVSEKELGVSIMERASFGFFMFLQWDRSKSPW